MDSLFNVSDWAISGVDVGVLVGYLLLMLAVGYVTKNISNDVSDYIRMGCKSTWWLMGLSIFMQAISAGTFTGNCAQAYLSGWSAILTGLGGVFGLICQAAFFAPWLRRTRAVTPADAVRQRFGPVPEQIFTYIGAFGGTFWGGVMMLGLANFISATFNLPVTTVILFVGIVIVFYSVSGGSWSVQITDSLQSFIMVPICLVVMILSLKAVGGLGGLFESIKAAGLSGDFKMVMEMGHEYTSKAGRVKAGYFTIPWIVASFIYSFIISANMTNCHRYLSTKSGTEARKAAILAAVLLFIGSFIWYIPPMVGRVKFEQDIDFLAREKATVEEVQAPTAAPPAVKPEAPATAEDEQAAATAEAAPAEKPAAAGPAPAPAPEKKTNRAKLGNPADGAYAVVAKKLLPPGLLGLVLIAMLAATMSSMDSALTGTAGLVTKNIYPPLARRFGKKPWEGKKLLRLTQAVNLLLGIWAISLAIMLYHGAGDSSIYDISLKVVLLIGLPNVLSFALSFFVKRLTWWGPLMGMGFGFFNSACFMFVPKIAAAHPDIAWLGAWSGWINGLMWHQKMLVNGLFTLVPTLSSVLWWKTSTDEYKAQVDKFFENLRTPIDFKKEVGASEDNALLRMVGGLGLVMAAAIAILIFFAPDATGRLSVVFIVACIGLISGLMYWKGRKGDDPAPETPAG